MKTFRAEHCEEQIWQHNYEFKSKYKEFFEKNSVVTKMSNFLVFFLSKSFTLTSFSPLKASFSVFLFMCSMIYVLLAAYTLFFALVRSFALHFRISVFF